MAGDGGMWRQSQMGLASADEWEKDAANRCAGCGGKAAADEFVWIWGASRLAQATARGMYCLRCAPPPSEPRGADIAAAVRRSAGEARP